VSRLFIFGGGKAEWHPRLPYKTEVSRLVVGSIVRLGWTATSGISYFEVTIVEVSAFCFRGVPFGQNTPIDFRHENVREIIWE